MGEGGGREIRRVCGCGWRLRWRGEAERGWGGCVRVVLAVQVYQVSRHAGRHGVSGAWRSAGGTRVGVWRARAVSGSFMLGLGGHAPQRRSARCTCGSGGQVAAAAGR